MSFLRQTQCDLYDCICASAELLQYVSPDRGSLQAAPGISGTDRSRFAFFKNGWTTLTAITRSLFLIDSGQQRGGVQIGLDRYKQLHGASAGSMRKFVSALNSLSSKRRISAASTLFSSAAAPKKGPNVFRRGLAPGDLAHRPTSLSKSGPQAHGPCWVVGCRLDPESRPNILGEGEAEDHGSDSSTLAFTPSTESSPPGPPPPRYLLHHRAVDPQSQVDRLEFRRVVQANGEAALESKFPVIGGFGVRRLDELQVQWRR